MESLEKKPLTPEEPDTYLLIDGSTVTADEAVRVGVKGRKTLRNFGLFVTLVGVLVLVQGIIDLFKDASGWIVTLFVEIVLFGFAFCLFYYGQNSDDERYGVSLLNFQKRMRRQHPQDALVFNEIAADTILELNVKMGNLLYLNTEKKQWQYRLKNKLSPIFEKGDLASFELVKNGLKFDSATPDLSIPDADHDQFGILLRFASFNRPSVELECRSHQVAMEGFEALTTLKK